MDESDSATRTLARTGSVVLIYDPEGRLKATSGGAFSPPLSSAEGLAISAHDGRSDGAASGEAVAPHFADIFGSETSLARWLAGHYLEARGKEDYHAEGELEHNGIPVGVRIENLKQRDRRYGFALYIVDRRSALSDGDAIVTRQQWHDIKNHLGGIKLYATFLKRKLADQEDLPIVDKILNGINGLIDQMARIRRGE